MAIILYKPGNMTKIRGIPCQLQVCNEFSYLHLLEEGWFYTPEECYEEKEVEETAPEDTEQEAEEETEADESALVDSTHEEIRAAAKNAEISYWHTKSIDRLINELKELNDAE